MDDDSSTIRAHNFVVAIDFGGTKVAVATADMEGSILKQARLDTDASQGAQQLLERTTGTALALIERTMEEVGGQCVAVGVSTPGVVHDNGVLLSPIFQAGNRCHCVKRCVPGCTFQRWWQQTM